MSFHTKKQRINKNFQNEKNEEYSGLDDLWYNEKYLINYNINITKLLSEKFKHSDILLDFGAGIGTITKNMQSRGYINIKCYEIDKRERKIMHERGLKVIENLNDETVHYDGIISSNVLEHIENDLSAIQKIHSILKKNGYLAIYVPVFQILFSDLDYQMGHYRRYDFKRINKLLSSNGFQIVKLRYADSLGFFASFILKIFGYHKTFDIGGKRSFQFYDKFVFPISIFLDNLGFNRLFGKNLIVIAKAI